MKRRNFIISAILVLAFCLMGIIGAKAQIFIMEDDFDNIRDPKPTGGFILPDLPGGHDSTLDWTPVGNGIWLLGCLGGAYLLGKRRKSKTDSQD